MIALQPMDNKEFKAYLELSINDYASEHVRAGNWTEEEALTNATEQFNMLLPDGENSEGQKLFSIRDDEKEVGMIWLGLKPNNKGFIYDIRIWEDHQGHGYGKQAMQEIEAFGRELGLTSIGLHVFGHNTVARELYKKLGYVETDIVMDKAL
ncbi:GNAT family N-acetyltransferase [Thalassobacillus hwangdonensis]|uniref:GNAT family N-acetyltransferase n=1 Tax=Thalassobacillus hwangdonensis TaxID=546108 RepID=A0ABW3L2Q1_9BACI